MKKIKLWKGWAEGNSNGWLHKLLVLIGIEHSPTFEFYKAFNSEVKDND